MLARSSISGAVTQAMRSMRGGAAARGEGAWRPLADMAWSFSALSHIKAISDNSLAAPG